MAAVSYQGTRDEAVLPVLPNPLWERLATSAAERPLDAALVSPDRSALTHSDLFERAGQVRSTLRSLGAEPGSRIAVVTSGAAEMAVALLCVAATSVAVPMNAAYRAVEWAEYFRRLKVDGLVWDECSGAAPKDAALAAGLPVLRLLRHEMTAAGSFELSLEGDPRSDRELAASDPRGNAHPDPLGLVFHTSGSTARPKVVPLSHSNLLAAASGIAVSLCLTPDDRTLVVMPPFHIHGFSAVLATLLTGGTIICPDRFEAPRFIDWLIRLRPTWYSAAPAIHRSILDRVRQDPNTVSAHALRFLRSASAPMPEPLRRELEAAFRVPVIQAYGMTEASPLIASNPLPPRERKPGSVGLPVGCEIAIVGSSDRFLECEERGEVVVRGPNVMSGYEDDPEENQRAFVAGWLRTGDEGYLDADGYLSITGRLKHLVNRGGEKISPYEIETCLLDHPGVIQAAAAACPDERLGEAVRAAVVLREGCHVSEQELRDHLAGALAEFKIPEQIHFVTDLPFTDGGKLQRDRLVEQMARLERSTAPDERISCDRAPSSTDSALLEIWREVLGLEFVGRDDRFGEIGGDSILAGLIAARVERTFGVVLPVLAFFDTPTPAQMSSLIDGLGQSSRRQTVTPERRPPGAEPVLSYAQQGLWVLEQLAPGAGSYHIFRAAHLRGPLSVPLLRRSLDQLVRRHEAMRSTITSSEGTPRLIVQPSGEFHLTQVDLSTAPVEERSSRIRAECVLEAQTPFDLARGPLWRGRLLRISSEEHVLVLSTHHIVGDRWTLQVLFRELAALYEGYSSGRADPLPPVSLQASDFASWQRQRLSTSELQRLTGYWTHRLANLPSALNLPTDYPRPALRSGKGARCKIYLSPEIAAAVRRVALEAHATLFMGLLAVFQCLLAALSGQSDIVVGTPVAGRPHVELEGVVGWLANTLVLRTDLGGTPSYREVVSRVREVCFSAFSHQELPFEQLVSALQPERCLATNPLFQVNFRLQNAPGATFCLPGITLTPLEIDLGVAKFDLAFELSEQPDGAVSGFCEYATDLFSEPTAMGIADGFARLADRLLLEPDRPASEVAADCLCGGGESATLRAQPVIRGRRSGRHTRTAQP